MWARGAILAIHIQACLSYLVAGTANSTALNTEQGDYHHPGLVRRYHVANCSADQERMIHRSMGIVAEWANHVLDRIRSEPEDLLSDAHLAFLQVFGTSDDRTRGQIQTRFFALRQVAAGRHVGRFTFVCRDVLLRCWQGLLAYPIRWFDPMMGQTSPGEAVVRFLFASSSLRQSATA